MRAKWIRFSALTIGPVVALAEVGRRWGEVGFFPKAFDDILAGILLMIAALSPRERRMRLLFGAWAFFSGMMMVALVTNLDYLLRADTRTDLALSLSLAGLFVFGLFAAMCAVADDEVR